MPALFLGKGDGTFVLQSSVIIEGVPNTLVRPLVVADFNGDGRPDLGLDSAPYVMAILNTTR